VAHQRPHPPTTRTGDWLTVNELLARSWRHVESYYVKDAAPTSEPDTIRQALRFVRQLYGHTEARDFGPLAPKAVRDARVARPITHKVKAIDPATGREIWLDRLERVGLARRHVNKQVQRIRRMFASAVEEEPLTVEVHQALLRVQGLAKGKTAAREKPRVGTVPDASVDAALPLVPPTVQAMVEVQRLCG
jgi:hypothetical protein